MGLQSGRTACGRKTLALDLEEEVGLGIEEWEVQGEQKLGGHRRPFHQPEWG